MLKLTVSGQYKRDHKTILRRGWNVEYLKDVLEVLLNEKKLDRKYRDHELSGNYVGYRECHIESAWLLIYKIVDGQLKLHRTGSHSDLF